MILRTLITSWAMATLLWAQAPDTETPQPAPEAPQLAPETETPQPPATEEDEGIKVSVLGYHEFTLDGEETEMRIRTAKFRSQMEAIRTLGIPVISMDDFIAWKCGEKELEKNSIVITIDDGWKSTYDQAFPILKEFNYPFTIYLYKNYVDGGGKALTTNMIREMLRANATLGSHSVSHPYPLTFKKFRSEGADAYDQFLRQEIGASKRYLETRFRTKTPTYSYPGGYITEEMLPVIKEFGYSHAFSTKPGKVILDSDNLALPRFMILGNYDRIFEFATTFTPILPTPPVTPATPGDPAGPPPIADPNNPAVPQAPVVETSPFPVFPEAGSIINSRLPEIHVDLAKVENLDPATLVMKVSGFTEVPAKFNPDTKRYSWQVNRRLRQPTCEVIVTWKDTEGNPPETPLRWSFQIDREAAYLLERE